MNRREPLGAKWALKNRGYGVVMHDASTSPSSDSVTQLTPEQIDELAHDIARHAALVSAATYELLVKIRIFDEAKGWAKQGARDCAAWLSWRTGVGRDTAKQQLEVARRLVEFPRVADAFRKGELSYTKARAVVRAGMPSEKDEVLLHQARGASGAELERICAAYRRCAPGAQLTDDEHRHVRKTFHRDVTVSIRVLPDEAEHIYRALGETKRALAGQSGEREGVGERHSAEAKEPAKQAESTPAPSLADAAVAMAEQQLARLQHAGGGGGDFSVPRNRPAAERRQLLIHLREARICDEESWTAELHDGTPLQGDTFKRLACDCGLTVAKTDDSGDPLDIGRRRRTVSSQLLRVLLMRDRHCQFPGCTQRAFLDAHHIQHWFDGGPTSKDNLVLTCHRHHLCLHEGGFSAQRNDDGSLSFFEPDGTPIADSLLLPNITGNAEDMLREDADARGLHIDHDTNLVQHNGHGLDLHAAVDALLPLDYKLGRSAPSPSA